MDALRWFYRCPACGADYELEPGRYLCGPCAAGQVPLRPLAGVLECAWEGEWRGGPDEIPLPVAPEHLPPIPMGPSPLWEPRRLREETGFPFLYLKDDTSKPSGSFKDRASRLVAGFALRHGIREIALASTGNAASSMAAFGAAAGIKVTVFLPKRAPAAKRVQVLQYGAELREVEGTYDLAFDLSLRYSAETGVLSRNTAYNPLTIEGKKTVSFELVRDLAASLRRPIGDPAGAFVAPDHVFVPTGDGVILSGVYRGFEDLIRLGRISKMPTLWACQAAGSSAIARALASGGFGPPVGADTAADSISVDVPRNGAHALSKLRAYGGRAVTAADPEIFAAQRELASKAGLFVEPSSAAAWAGFLAAKKDLDPAQTVVVLLTGSGLKDIAGAMKGLGIGGSAS